MFDSQMFDHIEEHEEIHEEDEDENDIFWVLFILALIILCGGHFFS